MAGTFADIAIINSLKMICDSNYFGANDGMPAARFANEFYAIVFPLPTVPIRLHGHLTVA